MNQKHETLRNKCFHKRPMRPLLKAGIKIARRNINNLRYVGDTTLMVESKEELKSLLMT